MRGLGALRPPLVWLGSLQEDRAEGPRIQDAGNRRASDEALVEHKNTSMLFPRLHFLKEVTHSRSVLQPCFLFIMATVSPSAVQSFLYSHFPSNLTSESFFNATPKGASILFNYKWTILAVVLVSPALLGFLQYLLFKDRPPKGLKLVPGPGSTIPYIGRVDIDAAAPWNSMRKWSDQFQGFFRLQACGEMHIWLGDSDIAQEMFCKRAATYSSRPEVPAVPGSHAQGQYLPLLEHGGKFLSTCSSMIRPVSLTQGV